jgi:3-oxoadipate enol-lactonase
MREVAGRVPGSRFVELPGTHFLPLQFPEQIAAELRALVARIDLAAKPNDPGKR